MFKFGSVCHPNVAVRQRALDHMLECADIMRVTGFADEWQQHHQGGPVGYEPCEFVPRPA